MAELTHIDEQGMPRMVDVSGKPETKRRAQAKGMIYMKPETLSMIRQGTAAKGDVLAAAKIAGIMAAKHTWQAIPMCHNIPVTGADIAFEIDERSSAVQVTASAATSGRTGIEMEALYAASCALLTIYDMCKAADRGMRISDIRLVYKDGGKTGVFEAK